MNNRRNKKKKRRKIEANELKFSWWANVKPNGNANVMTLQQDNSRALCFGQKQFILKIANARAQAEMQMSIAMCFTGWKWREYYLTIVSIVCKDYALCSGVSCRVSNWNWKKRLKQLNWAKGSVERISKCSAMWFIRFIWVSTSTTVTM